SLLSREKIRARFETRFTVRRMVDDYLDVYRSLSRHHASRTGRDGLEVTTLRENGHESRSRPGSERARAPRT
ncbi:MAG TPA: hypothetical protein VNQ15_14050, partial [Verrucomicrobiae bacterium]|nr:hypothetical protein [Verrucomicrobiae bacterium]